MRNIVIGLVFFSLLLNLSVGIMMTAVPAFEGMDNRLGLGDNDKLNQSYSDNEVLDEFGNPVNGYPTAEDSTNINSDTLMDRVGLGALSNLGNVLNKYMFGFVEVLHAIFGSYVPALIFTGMKYVIGIMYAILMIELFTGKRILGD